jgi:AraC-like DNA-binding protein
VVTAFDLHVRVLVAETVRIGPDWWNLTNLRNGFWRLYHHEGAGAGIRLDGRLLAFQPGRQYLVPAGVTFDLACDEELQQVYVHFDVSGLTAGGMDQLLSGPIEVPNPNELRPLMLRLSSLLAQPRPSGAKVACQAMAAVHEALSLCLEGLPNEALMGACGLGAEAADLAAALQAIDERPSHRFTVDELAGVCGMSCDSFAKRFNMATGRTPIQYVRQRRVKVAENRLLFTNMSLEEIAADAGFGTREYFARVFRAVTGCSPAAYRARRRV